MTDVFHQIYNPVGGSVFLSALVASVPPLLLALLLAVLRVAPWRAAVAAAATAFLLAWLVWGMPLSLTIAATTHGMAFGLWPISWIVVSAVFFYNLTVESGDFDVIRRSLARLTGDRRIQLLLVAFCFGALIEGIAGFGAPVAITASMLAGLGFEPIMAASLALIANTAPVAFGSLGIPVTTLGGLLAPMLGHDTQTTTRALSAMVGRQLPIFSLAIPAYLVVLYAGWRRMVEVWPAVLVAGATFAIGQFTVSNFVGPGADRRAVGAHLADVGRAAAARVAAGGGVHRRRAAGGRARPAAPDTSGRVVRAYATLRRPDRHGADRPDRQLRRHVGAEAAGQRDGAAQVRPGRQQAVSGSVDRSERRRRSAGLPLPGVGVQLAGRVPRCRTASRAALVQREAPVVAASSPYPLTYRLDFLAAAGTLVFLASLLAFVPMLMFGVPASALGDDVRRKTVRQLRLPVITIAFILSIATVMNYSGMTSSMALALAKTGVMFPFFAAWLGMIGVFLTGSDTSSNTLFGPLQATTAKLSGLDPVLMAATNSSAGVMGKMISPQNLSVGAAGVGAVGREGEILAKVIVHSLILTTLMGIVAMLQAYVVPWMVPKL